MISIGFKTDKGKTRQDNEDSVFVLPDRNLYMVADGVGGQSNGELASRTAVGYMAQFAALHPIGEVREGIALKHYFMSLLSGANELIYGKANGEQVNTGMATTALLCYLRNDNAYVVNVGDSRAYLVRDGLIMQVTTDHTLIQEMLDSGEITEEQAKSHPEKHVITRAVGGEPTVDPDFFSFRTYPGDTIVLCTDGLYGMVAEEEIARVASASRTMHGLARSLVDMANEGGGEDNITVVCVRIQ
ncbi:MAG: Stp1/IreP family PP2C-type Ser/Thr phosphatase [Firmicutes bacterium]|nr:Stp1/IreP family PP2C-type Ser/Thr phosphatase [Bacillota bacterium]